MCSSRFESQAWYNEMFALFELLQQQNAYLSSLIREEKRGSLQGDWNGSSKSNNNHKSSRPKTGIGCIVSSLS